MYAVELVEGKDRTPQIIKQFENLGKTVGFLLCLTRNIWNSGKMVVLDSRFCVLQGTIELRRRGVFAAAVIKKR
jgi:Transposase IS4